MRETKCWPSNGEAENRMVLSGAVSDPLCTFAAMSVTSVPREITRQFSAFSAAFANSQEPFAAFLNKPLSGVETLIEQATDKLKQYDADSRKALVDEITRQTAGRLSEKQEANLELLKSKTTVTITTGHQLTLLAGPMYFIYKALHVVKLAEAFNAQNAGMNAVPVFWLASEDHDFEEVKSASLFNKDFTWETDQTGPVGRFSLDKFEEIQTAVLELFSGHPDAAVHRLLAELPQTNYADWMQTFVLRLFADYGVLVLQPDSHELKKGFIPVLRRELLNQPSFPAVQETNKKLEAAGWKPQAQARACNLFYLDATGRHRIDPSANGFTIDGKAYSQEELLEIVETNPERFSPNVILRPVYQETILPNIAYVGGGGEMAYWVQLKAVFEAHQTLFPVIVQRVSLHLLDQGTQKRIAKLGWAAERFFMPKEHLRKQYLLEQDSGQLDMTEVQEKFQQLRLSMIAKAKEIDVTLESYAEAETVRMHKQIESYEQRLIKQLKQQHEQALKNIDAVCDRFVVGSEIQERVFHWLNFAATGDYPTLFNQIYKAIDPFDQDLIMVEL